MGIIGYISFSFSFFLFCFYFPSFLVGTALALLTTWVCYYFSLREFFSPEISLLMIVVGTIMKSIMLIIFLIFFLKNQLILSPIIFCLSYLLSSYFFTCFFSNKKLQEISS